MTDLLSRPATTSASGETPPTRSLSVSAALAALGAVTTGLVLCMALALVGWFLADGGAHGETTDALRVGADAWLVGHGSGISVGGVPLGIVPLALTALVLLVILRTGRWAARTSAPVDGDRPVLLAGAVFAGVYVVLAVLTCLLAAVGSVSPGLGRTIVAALLLSGAGGTLAMASGTGRLSTWTGLVPGWIRSICFGAASGALLLVAAASVLVAVSMVRGLNEAGSMMSQLQLGTGDVLAYTVVAGLLAPNAVLLGAAYLLGPGFVVGTGTVVSPSVVVLGQVPAFPLLAALPGSGPTPGWAMAFLAAPVLAGAVGAVLAQRSYGVTAWDSAALRGFGSGFGAAVLTTVVVALAGGAMGTGRMAHVGAPVGEVLVAALMAMCAGGLVAGLATAAWQRHRWARTADRSAESDDDAR